MIGLLTYIVAYLYEAPKRFIPERSCTYLVISMCFPVPNKQTLHQPHTLPLVRPVILSWVDSFLYASEKVVRLD